jgi:hypothetical protein
MTHCQLNNGSEKTISLLTPENKIVFYSNSNKSRSGFYSCYFLLIAMLLALHSDAQMYKKDFSPLVLQNGVISYKPDSLGNRIPDFSYCGYMASEKPIPIIPVKVIVPVTKGDATLRIQSALDHVASLPLDANGFRGAVLLQKGTYEVLGQLRITASGVVLRGSGVNETTIVGAGTGRLALIKIIGKNDRTLGEEMEIMDSYVPVNATKFNVEAKILLTQSQTNK